ncbi:MAG: beta-N-acetylhexosaminidase [Magnetococcales bacterium]|nr:beta-N-acetylhexosaminidase [Magnetococcales bacterium]
MNKIYTNSASERREGLACRRLVMGISGPELSGEERGWLQNHSPAGIILFSRNLTDLATLLNLVRSIREVTPVPPTLWIDQEGGRVQRLRTPFTRYPSPLRFARHEGKTSLEEARHLAYLAGSLNGMELQSVGIGVNCAPVLDIWEEGADPVIGERAFGRDPQQVIRLAGAWLAGFSQQGGLAMGKHFPGHGAATADSHHALPVVQHGLDHLLRRELLPFQALLPQLPALMTAHLVATAIDAENPATCSSGWLREWLRDRWGYQGLIVSDALEMKALSGTLADRATRAIQAGCDLVLCCTGRLDDSLTTLEGIIPALDDEAVAMDRRIEVTLAPVRVAPGDPWQLMKDETYQHDRRLVERLAEETLANDPTEWNLV